MIEAAFTGYRLCCPRRFRGGMEPESEKYVAIIDRMPAEQLPDEELVARYQSTVEVREREQYIDELFRRNYPRVARWCLRFASDREAAADLAQEIFTKAYQNLSSFQAQSKFSTWLFVIARNHCLNALRTSAKQPTEIGADEGEEVLLGIPDGGLDAFATFAREQSAKMVRQLLNEALDETEKVVFTLHYGEEWTLDAITRLLRLENPSGAKAYIVSAKRKLTRLVQQWKARGQCV
jgi:RNA polymerase sigma-70 factor (ECF subfamily)